MKILAAQEEGINVMQELLLTALKAALAAGDEIMAVYNAPFSVSYKEDESPLTEADKRAHLRIAQMLADTNIPLLSEEGKHRPYEERKNWHTLWVVDPLDGTKEFVKRNGEFTVNIALIKDNYPVLGVIYAPVRKEIYFAAPETGACKYVPDDTANTDASIILANAIKLPISLFSPHQTTFNIVASRSHMSAETEQFVKEMQALYTHVELVSMGSSLKICLVAEGSAHAYPRYAPTMEWDTAAGQAIAEHAGCAFTDYETKQRLKYNKENLRNNWFLVSGKNIPSVLYAGT